MIIGGEGNGGVIYPELHYGRDALVGIALFLTHLAESNMDCSVLRKCYPDYFMSKNKINLDKGVEADALLEKFADAYAEYDVNRVDGVKVDMPEGWVHLRKSNTEPIIRLYAEAGSSEEVERIVSEAKQSIQKLVT